MDENKQNSSNEFIEEPKKEKKTNGTVKYTIYILVVILVTALSIFLALKDCFGEVTELLKNSNVSWLFITLGIMFISILIRAVILFFFARLYEHDYHYHQALAVEQIGVFYSAVTPGSTGGQFMEAYMFQKQGIPVSNAVSMLAMYSIVYQAVLIVYGILAFIIKFDFLNGIGAIRISIGQNTITISIWLLTIIGFLLNIGVIVLVFLMSYWKGFHNFIMGPCISLLNKVHLVKQPDKTRENLRIHVENFKLELRRLLTNIPFTILITLMFVVFFTLRFSLPYFCGLALHNESTSANFWDAVFLSNYHQMVTGLIPIPGSAGISEYFFLELFVNKTDPSLGFFYIASSDPLATSSALGSASLLIWRTVSFTLPLAIAGIVTAFYRTSGKTAKFTESDFSTRQTMLEMKRETLVARQDDLNTIIHTNALTKDAIESKVSLFHKRDEKIKDNSHDQDEYHHIDIGGDDD